METLNDLVRSGKVRYIGFSNWPASKAAMAVTVRPTGTRMGSTHKRPDVPFAAGPRRGTRVCSLFARNRSRLDGLEPTRQRFPQWQVNARITRSKRKQIVGLRLYPLR